METLQLLLDGFASALTPQNLLAGAIGCLVGTIVGILPGLGPANTIALLIPVAFYMQPDSALIMMTALYMGAMYGGTLTSVLVNMPGEAASVMTAVDGYQLALRGRAGATLAVAAIGSFVGGVIATVGLAFLVTPLAALALQFGPAEYFAVIVMALLLSMTLIGNRPLVGLMSITLGLMVATIGNDLQTGVPRFTFGSVNLLSGIDIVLPIIGLFGIAEILWNLKHPESVEKRIRISGRFRPSKEESRASAAPVLRGSVVGFVAGVLPGAGTTLGSYMAYAIEKRKSKTPERFGKGAIEGVAAAETANNAATAGSLVPMLALGIPGSGTTAVLLAYMVMYGIQPGPGFFVAHGDLAWAIIASLFISNLLLVVLNLPLIPLFCRLLDIPVRFLYPGIVAVALIGAFSLNGSAFDVGLVVVFGIVGYVMRMLGMQPVLLVLGLVLGNILEVTFRQSMALSLGDPLTFLTKPISASLLAVGALVVIVDMVGSGRRRRAGRAAAGDLESSSGASTDASSARSAK